MQFLVMPDGRLQSSCLYQYGPECESCVLIAYAQIPEIKDRANVSSGVCGLTFILRLYLPRLKVTGQDHVIYHSIRVPSISPESFERFSLYFT